MSEPTYSQVFTNLERCVGRRARAAGTVTENLKVESDAVWYAIRTLAAAVDGLPAAEVRAILIGHGYDI